MKNAIVTGGTSGIGKSIVWALLKRGYFVYTNTIGKQEEIDEADNLFRGVSDSFQISYCNQGDLTQFESFISKVIENAHEIDCIICNSGITARGKLIDISDEDWLNVMNVAVNSHFKLIRECLPYINRNSRIVFTGSMMGIMPHSMSIPYGVSKAAVHSLAKNLVKEFEGTDTTVNVIAPGFVNTPWQKNKPQEIKDSIISKTAIKRFADPDEISSAVMFCIDNAFVNGAIIEISGGYCFK